eukprot:TRINITY_DN2157_c0_g1_i2.p1 TRINITY_DN2157_c0_g1~~TRINITY_DN2157_c0_g1_i2.p1  ORF type:complete len:512 (-),score=222.57 TRINITY_DN2157_c0_g1_i2:124-1659(-)
MLRRSQSIRRRFESRQQESAPNPFLNGTHFRSWADVPAYEIFKYVVVGLTLAPVRLLLTLLLHLVAVAICAIAGLFVGADVRAARKPTPAAVRAVLMPLLRGLARLMLFVWGYHYIPVKGRAVGREQAPIVVANHTTFVDVYWMFYAYGACPVAKEAVGRIPLVGFLARTLQTVFVSRTDSQSRSETQDAIKLRATEPGWPQIMLFPEGTCENNTALITYRLGAFQPGLPVQPVALNYRWRHFDPSWVAYGPGPGQLLLKMLCQFGNRLEVTFLPVTAPTDAERAEPKVYADHVRERTATVLGVPVTNHSFEDMMLMTSVHEGGRPAETLKVPFQQLRKLHQVNLGDVQEMLRKFAEIDVNKDGSIDYDEFVSVLGVIGITGSPFTKQIFQMLDSDQSGTLDFNEFVCGLVQYSKSYSAVESVELALQVFGLGDKQRLGRDDLTVLFQRFQEVHAETVEQVMHDIDADASGSISRDEFVSYASGRADISYMFRQFERREGLTASTRHLRLD